jgi:D-threo-aldose 1-dehydrogenase
MLDPFASATLGGTGVRVTRLGLGTAALGGWPCAVPREQAVATLERAWEHGVRYFDTAPFYGHGLSERNIGAALGGRDRRSYTLSTKVGRVLVPGKPVDALYEGVPDLVPVFDFSAAGVLRSLEDSRARMGIAQIDVAFIHDPDDHHEAALSGAYEQLAALRAEGVIGAIGVGMNHSEPLARFLHEADFDCMLVAGRYTLLEQDSLDDLFPAARERGASIIAGAVFNSGLLVDPGEGSTYDYAPAPRRVIERAGRIREVCERHGVPLRTAALQFPLLHPQVACVLAGARTTEEVDDTVALLRHEVPSELWEELKRTGLMREDAPTTGSRTGPMNKRVNSDGES